MHSTFFLPVLLRYILMPFRLFLVLAVLCLVQGVVQKLRMRFSVPFVLYARFPLFGQYVTSTSQNALCIQYDIWIIVVSIHTTPFIIKTTHFFRTVYLCVLCNSQNKQRFTKRH